MNKEVIIGVYNDYDPINKVRKERLEALLKESKEQNVRLVFFENEDIDFREKIVNGKYHAQNGWQNIKTKIPEVTINLFPTVGKDKTIVDLKLGSETIYTAHLIEGKLGVYERILNSGKLVEHVIPSQRVHSVEAIMDYMEAEDQAVLKPTGGRQGQNIYFLYNEKGKIYFKDHLEKVEVDLRGLKRIIGDKIDQNEYIIQPYINARTKKDEPYDFRFHVQKNGDGKWVLTRAYPRIGNPKSIISTKEVSKKHYRLSYVEDILKEERPNDWKEFKIKLKDIAIKLAEHIDELYGNKTKEFGIDLVLDKNNNIWMFEANTGPQTQYEANPCELSRSHDNLRSKRDIQYAKFLRQEKLDKDLDRQLESLSMALLELEKNLLLGGEKKKNIGILADDLNHSDLKMALSFMAENLGFNSYYFTEGSIDFKKKLILGYSYEGTTVKQELVPYPDLIINLSGLMAESKRLQELREIPKTREIDLGLDSKLDIQEGLLENEELNKYVLELICSDDMDKVREFISKEDYLVLKEGDRLKSISELDEDLDLGDLISKKTLVQAYRASKTREGRPFSVKVRMVKDGNKEWKIVRPYVQVNNNDDKISSLEKGGHIVLLEKWSSMTEELREEILLVSRKVASQIDLKLAGGISMLEVTFGRDSNENIFIYDIDLNDIKSRFAEVEMAESLFSYALTLI